MIEKLIDVKLLADANVIKETLSRIGIANKAEKILYPSCYLYINEGVTYIAHFKELFPILKKDGYSNISEMDIKRRNAIIFCLMNWGLIECDYDISDHDAFVFVLPFKEKSEWQISHKLNRNLLSEKRD